MPKTDGQPQNLSSAISDLQQFAASGKKHACMVSALTLMGRGFSFLTATDKNINTGGWAATRQQGPGRPAQAREGRPDLRPPRRLSVPDGWRSVRRRCRQTLGQNPRRLPRPQDHSPQTGGRSLRDRGLRWRKMFRGVRSGECEIRGTQDRGGSLSCLQRQCGSVRSAPGGSLPYQARMPCSVDTPELPCGIPGLCTAFKSPTPKFTKLLLAAAAAGCAAGGPAG